MPYLNGRSRNPAPGGSHVFQPMKSLLLAGTVTLPVKDCLKLYPTFAAVSVYVPAANPLRRYLPDEKVVVL